MARYIASLVVMTCLAGLVIGQEAAGDKKKFQGVWDIAFLEAGGVRAPGPKVDKGLQVIVNGDNLKVISDEIKDDAGMIFKLDPAKKPKAIDLRYIDGPYKGRTVLGIYAFDGAALKLCFPDDPDDAPTRPKTFATKKGSSMRVYTLKKVK
jgi:uncharacterized protein (TIGR03067 family)